MSIHNDNNGNDMGNPTKIKANKGTNSPIRTASFKDGISKLPPLNGPNSYPKQGRINTGKDKLDVVP